MPLWGDFKWTNRIRILNKTLGVVVVILSILIVNLLSFRYFSRFDFQKRQNFSLDRFSLNVMELVEDPIEIYLFYGHTQDDGVPFFVNDLRNLLKEYKHVAPTIVRVKFIDMLKQPRITEELSLRFGSIASNSVVISSREHFRIIPAFELYEFTNGIVSGFRGERVISDEILKLSNRETKKILFSTGHGEIDIDSVHPLYGSSSVSELLRQNGYSVEKIKQQEPLRYKYAQLLVIVGAQTKFSENEVQILRKFLEENGRILVLLSAPKSCGLEDLFFDWGILADDMLVINSNDEKLGISGDNIIDNFSGHKMMQPMLDMQLSALLGLCQPVRMDIGSPATSKCKVTSLFSSGEKTFAKLDYLRRKPTYNPAEDLAGPISVAVLSEVMIDEKSVGTKGKLLVIGSSNFINNNHFYVLGNRILFHSIVSWLLDHDDVVSESITTRPLETYKITISKSDLYRIGGVLLLLSVLLLVFGYFVAWIRRMSS